MSIYNSARVQKALGANIPKDEKEDSGRKADPKTEDIIVIKYCNGEFFESNDKDSDSDVYCRVGVVKRDGIFTKQWLSKSKVEPNTLKPHWDQDDEFILKKSVNELVLEAFDRDSLFDYFIGRARFDISKLGTISKSLSLKLYKEDGKNNECVGVVNITIKKLNLSSSVF